MARSKRPPLKQRLAEVEQNVNEGERLLEQQRQAIEDRQLDGRSVALAIYLLGRMEERQRSLVANRDRLLAEMSKPTKGRA